jgi:hypothetical protein
VVEDGGPVEEQAEVGLEAVGAGAEGLLERRQGVFGKAFRAAAMPENQELLRHP